MLELIISIVMSWGYPVESGTHFIMNSDHAQKIMFQPSYKELGGDEQFFKYVDIMEVDDVVITDGDEPKDEEKN